MPDLICPECGEQAELHHNMRWPCYQCPNGHDWRVGVHPDGVTPLGTLADPELRQLRQDVHSSFDLLWQRGLMTRHEAYRWLARQLALQKDDAHIACLNAMQCRRLLACIQRYLTVDRFHDAMNNQRIG